MRMRGVPLPLRERVEGFDVLAAFGGGGGGFKLEWVGGAVDVLGIDIMR